MRDLYLDNSIFKAIIGGIIAASLIALMAMPGNAAHNDGRLDGRQDGNYWITAQSQFDFRTISGPVRNGPVGDQVRLPGGTWLDCGYTCAYTLRTNTLDFFLCGDGGPNDCSPGILDDIIARRLR